MAEKIATLPKHGRPRASKACSSCHVRKVRCDVLSRGHPCTQCDESGFRCEVNERKKRRRKSVVHPINELNSHKTADSKPLPEHMMLHRVPFYPVIRNFAPTGRPNLSCKDTGRGIVLPVPNEHLNTLGEEDIEFLKRKGALELPDKEILDECITSYFHIFHPFFPVMDRSDFLARYKESNQIHEPSAAGPSLLLLQGIIFTACSVSCEHDPFREYTNGFQFISNASITKMGFTSRQKARNCFHRRARVSLSVLI